MKVGINRVYMQGGSPQRVTYTPWEAQEGGGKNPKQKFGGRETIKVRKKTEGRKENR